MLSSSFEFLSIKCYFIIFFGTSWGNHTSICLAISICWLTSKFSPFSILTKQLYSAQRASKGAVTKWIKLTWLVGGGEGMETYWGIGMWLNLRENERLEVVVELGIPEVRWASKITFRYLTWPAKLILLWFLMRGN